MSKAILVGYDPRKRDQAPVSFGAELAAVTGAPLIVASVQARAPFVGLDPEGTLPYGLADVDDDLLADCTPAIEQIDTELRARGVQVDCRILHGTSAARALQEAVEQEDAGLLVLGSSRRSAAGRVLAGSTAQRMLNGCPCPVAVVPRSWKRERPLRTIGVAYVDSPEGHEALRSAHALARRAGATLRVITVVRLSPSMYAETETYVAGQPGKDLVHVEGEHRVLAERRLRERLDADGLLGGDVPVEVEALVGDPADVLLDLSDGLDLLVAGSRGYGPVRGVLLGSVSRRLTAEARCPVIVLPRGLKAALPALLAEEAAAR
jgi:nucleotide-binding universal stress UspA family protein